MSRKSANIAALIESCQGHGLDPHYLGFFRCFNQQLFYESHDVLEELWLADRTGPDGDFYRGLIQLAGAFVHLQKGRLRPAASLFNRAQAHLQKYSPAHRGLDVHRVLILIADWTARLLADNFSRNPLEPGNAPTLHPLLMA